MSKLVGNAVAVQPASSTVSAGLLRREEHDTMLANAIDKNPELDNAIDMVLKHAAEHGLLNEPQDDAAIKPLPKKLVEKGEERREKAKNEEKAEEKKEELAEKKEEAKEKAEEHKAEKKKEDQTKKAEQNAQLAAAEKQQVNAKKKAAVNQVAADAERKLDSGKGEAKDAAKEVIQEAMDQAITDAKAAADDEIKALKSKRAVAKQAAREKKQAAVSGKGRADAEAREAKTAHAQSKAISAKKKEEATLRDAERNHKAKEDAEIKAESAMVDKETKDMEAKISGVVSREKAAMKKSVKCQNHEDEEEGKIAVRVARAEAKTIAQKLAIETEPSHEYNTKVVIKDVVEKTVQKVFHEYVTGDRSVTDSEEPELPGVLDPSRLKDVSDAIQSSSNWRESQGLAHEPTSPPTEAATLPTIVDPPFQEPMEEPTGVTAPNQTTAPTRKEAVAKPMTDA